MFHVYCVSDSGLCWQFSVVQSVLDLDFTFKRVLMKGIQFIFWTLFDNLCYYIENTWQLD